MENLLNEHHATALLARIDALHPESKAEWGKMNVGQMLAHIQVPILVAIGEKKLKRTLVGILFGGIAKRKLTGEKPFPKNLPTDPSFIKKEEHDFNKEKEQLVSLIKRVVASGEAGLTPLPHPFFGKMTNEEWGSSLWKHLDHHLRQFGV